MEARYYSTNKDLVHCELCPHYCKIHEGKVGICGSRENLDGKLISKVYGEVSALALDPIEKKPLYHFHPGKSILSLGSFGCNLKCNFCQNHHISQPERKYKDYSTRKIPAGDIINKAKNAENNIGIAFTYNEPVIWYEYMFDIAVLAVENNLKTAVISNGFINPKPLKDLIPYIDAFNIDLKSFDEAFYRKETGSKFKPVLESLEIIASSDSHLEITMLVIPGLNDDINLFKSMLEWIKLKLGSDIVLHLSKYFPNYKSNKGITTDDTLLKMFDLAKTKLPYVYLGNSSIETGRDTYCSACSNLQIKRMGYKTIIPGLDSNGSCSKCGKESIKHFSSS